MLFKRHKSNHNSNDFYFLSRREKAHDQRELHRENSKRRESRITTR